MSFETFQNHLEISGVLTTVTALRISAGRSTEPIGSDLPVIKDALGQPLIPGASFKGALRARLESFLRGINPDLAANPADEQGWAITPEDMQQLKDTHTTDQALTIAIERNTDFISKLFGSPWLASKLHIRDLTVPLDSWFGQYQERDGVAIDRDTETAAEGKLYDFQVVPAGTQFKFRAMVENATDAELGLLLFGLRQFETEQIPLGGGRSRGLGVVKLELDTWKWFDARHPEDANKTDPDALLQHLIHLIQRDDEQAYSPVDDALKDRWSQALIVLLREKAQPVPSNSN